MNRRFLLLLICFVLSFLPACALAEADTAPMWEAAFDGAPAALVPDSWMPEEEIYFEMPMSAEEFSSMTEGMAGDLPFTYRLSEDGFWAYIDVPVSGAIDGFEEAIPYSQSPDGQKLFLKYKRELCVLEGTRLTVVVPSESRGAADPHKGWRSGNLPV